MKPPKNSDNLQLWTIQPIEWYEYLLQNGVIYGNKKFIESDFLYPYHWLMQQMDNRIGKRPFAECYPVWAWFQYLGSQRKKPDLRCSGHLPKGEKGVRIELRKPKNEVLLSDIDLWLHPLNYWKINDSEEEWEEFNKMLTDNNIDFTNRENTPFEIRQEIEQSWDKVLDMNYEIEYAAHPFEKKSIQATFWSLSVEEIVKVEEFTAR